MVARSAHSISDRDDFPGPNGCEWAPIPCGGFTLPVLSRGYRDDMARRTKPANRRISRYRRPRRTDTMGQPVRRVVAHDEDNQNCRADSRDVCPTAQAFPEEQPVH